MTSQTKAAHTPGPWVSSTFGFQVLTGDSWSTICVLKGSAGWKDGRGAYEQEYEWQNQEANARLIAAAPDLLDALNEILAYSGGANSALEDIYVMERARDALAKAEGCPMPNYEPPDAPGFEGGFAESH